MKKRIGKINKNIEELNSLEKTPSELLDLFLQEKEAFNASAETVKQYRYHCVQYIQSIEDADTLPGYKVLTLDSYKNYIVELNKRDIKDVSIACIARSLRAWLYWLMENNYINPFHVKIPKYQKVVAETYTDEELAILLEKPGRNCSEVEYETWVFINVAIATGLRLSSILNIKVQDIHFSENTIVVNKTKNRAALSLVANDELLAILKRYVKLFDLYPEDYHFCTGEKGKLANRTMEDFVKRYNAKRGVQKKKIIHAFRHTFARNHYLQNRDMYRLKNLMGHTLISTTEHYLGTLGLNTSDKIEYNPQAQFIKKPKQTRNRRQSIHKK